MVDGTGFTAFGLWVFRSLILSMCTESSTEVVV